MTAEVHHIFWTESNPPVLKMANDDDGFYIQTFNDWTEVDAFILNMRTEAERAFGPNAVLSAGLESHD